MLSLLRAARPASARLVPTLPLCRCRLAPVLAPQHVLGGLAPSLSRSYASKKSKKGAATFDDDADVAEIEAKGKGKKGKGKGKALLDEADLVADAHSDGVFDLGKLEESMVDAVGKLRVGLKTVVGRVGRVTPGASRLRAANVLGKP